MKQQKVYKKDINVKLKKWGAEVDELKAKLDTADAQTRESIYKEVERLQELQQKAKDKLRSLKHAGKESFDDIKTGVENAVKSFGEAVDSALSRFK
jgi:phage tail tape-measure protein